MKPTTKKIDRITPISWRTVLWMSFNGVRHRAGRSLLTFLSITMAVAFLGYVLVNDAIGQQMRAADAAAPEGPPLIWVVIISLGVCVCGIANAMLMSVTERFREIATLKCLGALDTVVLRVYLLEALGQGLLGAVAGTVAGILLACVIGWFTYGGALGLALPWAAVGKASLWCFLVGISLAVAGAAYPTFLAAKMAPVEAMRAKF
jgi:ABC-type antimicrobial peptide transport system permease subunit